VGWAIGLVVALAGSAVGAEPGATSGAGGDPRSPGEGPGLVGDPGFAVAVVLVVAVLSVAGTLAYVRLTARRAGTGRG
jgi:hypothetical protein